jgi:hypothetical protein
MGVVCFFSPIFSYFCLFVAALRPCQGKLPRRKYMKTWPRDSRSSRLDCSVCRSEDESRPGGQWSYLFPGECLCSCIAQFHSGSCVRGMGCAALSLDHGIAWPFQNPRRVSLAPGQRLTYAEGRDAHHFQPWFLVDQRGSYQV